MRTDLKSTTYTTVGIHLVMCIVLCFLFGRWLDGKLGTEPYLTLIFFVLGVITGFRSLYQAAQKMQREVEKDGFNESQTGRSSKGEKTTCGFDGSAGSQKTKGRCSQGACPEKTKIDYGKSQRLEAQKSGPSQNPGP